MNKENVQAAINIMKRASLVSMIHWQSRPTTFGPARFQGVYDRGICKTEAEMHRCGNAACFAGWIAVSPEFKAAGGSSWEGTPTLKNSENDENDTGADAIAEWLGISNWLARCFVHGHIDRSSEGPFSLFYGKNWRDVGKDDVIAKLELVLAGKLE